MQKTVTDLQLAVYNSKSRPIMQPAKLQVSPSVLAWKQQLCAATGSETAQKQWPATTCSMAQCHNSNSDVIASQLKRSSQVAYQQCSIKVAAAQLLNNVQLHTSLSDIAKASSSCTHGVTGLMQLWLCAVTQLALGSS